MKRFEIRLGPTPGELWLTIGSGAAALELYKSPQRANECFYVDLAPGDHALTLRGHGADGFGVGLHIAELAKIGDAASAYQTFDLECGGADPCTLDALAAFKRSLARYPRGIHDPCGSVRVKNVGWETGKAPDMVTPQDLELRAVLDVYEFAPEHAHGDAACASDIE